MAKKKEGLISKAAHAISDVIGSTTDQADASEGETDSSEASEQSSEDTPPAAPQNLNQDHPKFHKFKKGF